MKHIEFARRSEAFSDNLCNDYSEQKNWIVTIRFYSYLHYVERQLDRHGYDSETHRNRKDNIRNCPHIDNRARSIYRLLEDLSKDARYECIEMTENDVEESEKKLDEGKEVLGFSAGDSNSDTKYST